MHKLERPSIGVPEAGDPAETEILIVMKPLHLIFISCFLVVLSIPSYGVIRIDTIYSYVTDQTFDSSRVYLVTKSTFSHSACPTQNVLIADSFNMVTIKVCISEGPLTATCTRVDTFDLGKRTNGLLVVDVTFFTSVNQCLDYWQTKTEQASFYIGSTAITEYPVVQKNNILVTREKVFGLNPSEQAVLSLFSMDGKMVQTKIISDPTFETDISYLSTGLYLIVFQNEKHRLVKRFVKE
jgi:hypothetical protein